MPAKPPMTITIADVERAAIAAYHARSARVFEQSGRGNPIDVGAGWLVLAIDQQIVGRRQSLPELLDLAKRGPV